MNEMRPLSAAAVTLLGFATWIVLNGYGPIVLTLTVILVLSILF